MALCLDYRTTDSELKEPLAIMQEPRLGVYEPPEMIHKIVASAFNNFIRFSEVCDPTKVKKQSNLFKLQRTP